MEGSSRENITNPLTTKDTKEHKGIAKIAEIAKK
jgi:hypothetical protein